MTARQHKHFIKSRKIIFSLLIAFITTGVMAFLTIKNPKAKSKNDQAAKHRLIKQHLLQVFQSTNQFWEQQLKDYGHHYRPPQIQFLNSHASGKCGNGPTVSGPFYCTLDETIYINLNFFEKLEAKFGAAGNATEAFVIAHEVGHHVQNIVGTTRKLFRLTRRSLGSSIQLFMRLELQADCYAGFWMKHAQHASADLHHDQLRNGLDAARRIGDDHVQLASHTGHQREVFSHGNSVQRARWFSNGTKALNIDQCNTFNTRLRR